MYMYNIIIQRTINRLQEHMYYSFLGYLEHIVILNFNVRGFDIKTETDS